MKILHICNDYCGSKVHANLFRRLDELGVEQTVYAYYRGGDVREKNVLLQLVEKPVGSKDAMNDEAINGQVAFFPSHHDKGEVAAMGGTGSLDKASNLAIVELSAGIGEIVGHLYKPCDMATIDNGKVNLIAAALTKIVDFLTDMFYASHQFYGHNILQSPSEVFCLEGILTLGDESEINGIALASCISFDALEGKLVDVAEQIGVVEIAKVVLDGVDGLHLKVVGDGVVGLLLTEDIEHVICQLVDGLFVAHLVATANVFLHDGPEQGLHVGLGMKAGILQQFRETSMQKVFVQRMSTEPFGLGGEAVRINLMECAVFCEGKGIEPDLVVATCHVGDEVTAEQVGIAAGHNHAMVLAEQTIDKQRPCLHILYLVEEQVGEGTINLIKRLQQGVEVGRLNAGKAFVVEVDVCELDPALHQDFLAEGGFPTSAHTDDNLCQIAIEVDLPFLPARTQVGNVDSRKFVLLVTENICESIHKCGFCDAKVVKRYETASKKEHKLHKTASFSRLNCTNRHILRCKLHKTASFRCCKLHKNDKNVPISET